MWTQHHSIMIESFVFEVMYYISSECDDKPIGLLVRNSHEIVQVVACSSTKVK